MHLRTRLNKLEQQTGDLSLVVIVGKEVDGVFIPNEDSPPEPTDEDTLILRIVDYYE